MQSFCVFRQIKVFFFIEQLIYYPTLTNDNNMAFDKRNQLNRHWGFGPRSY